MKRVLLFAFLSLTFICGPLLANQEIASPNTPESQVVKALLMDNTPAQKDAMSDVMSQSDKFSPAVLYPLSRALFVLDRKDEAAEWFYKAQLRAKFDAYRTEDISARQLTIILNDFFGKPINAHALQTPEKLRPLILKVIEWDKSTPHNYDPNWMAPHGIGVYDDKTPGPSDWKKLAEDTRAEYLDGLDHSLRTANWDEIKTRAKKSRATFEPITEENTQDAPQDESNNNSVYSKID